MNAEEFARMWRAHAEGIVEELFDPESQGYIGELLPEGEFSDKQIDQLRPAIRSIILEDYFSFLLALDGAVSIAKEEPDGSYSMWRDYCQVLGSNGRAIYARGELEAAAWKWLGD